MHQTTGPFQLSYASLPIQVGKMEWLGGSCVPLGALSESSLTECVTKWGRGQVSLNSDGGVGSDTGRAVLTPPLP